MYEREHWQYNNRIPLYKMSIIDTQENDGCISNYDTHMFISKIIFLGTIVMLFDFSHFLYIFIACRLNSQTPYILLPMELSRETLMISALFRYLTYILSKVKCRSWSLYTSDLRPFSISTRFSLWIYSLELMYRRYNPKSTFFTKFLCF